jgi:RNA polymerase sigma-70 factor (ECF subfamily)
VRYSGTIESGTAEGTGTFEELFQREHARLFGTLCLATGDGWEAEELMQESFLKVWERWDRVRGHPDPAGYLYRTAFNLHRSRLRRVARAARRAVAVPPPADPFSGVEERHSLFTALRRLPRRQRTALVLLDLLDLTSEEAGRLLGIRAVTARVLASQARAALREVLGEEHE